MLFKHNDAGRVALKRSGVTVAEKATLCQGGQVAQAHRQGLMMVAVCTSETSANFYSTTRRNIPESCHFDWLSYYQLLNDSGPCS